MFLTHRTERHSLRWKCTPCLTFRESAKLLFVCMKDGSLTFSSPGQLFRQMTCLLSNCQLRPRHLPLLSAWVPAVLSNKPLTLLKRWHFSSLFIKLPKEHLSWGANRRGTGEKCFSPGFPELFQASWTALVSLSNPSNIRITRFSRTGDPGRQIHPVWKLRLGRPEWLEGSESTKTVSEVLLKEYAEGKFFLITPRVRKVKELLIKYPWLTGVAPGIILHFDRPPMLENK